MSREEVELEEFFDAPTTWDDIAAASDGSLVHEPTQIQEDDLSSQAAELSASTSQDSSRPSNSDSGRRSLSDVTQLLLASTAFIACLGTLVALGIQIWSVKVQQSQRMARSVYLSKRDEGLCAFSLNGSTCAQPNTWQFSDTKLEFQTYEFWEWRITAVLSLSMNYR